MSHAPHESPSVSRHDFGTMPDGTPVAAFTIRNRHGVVVRIMEYGGIVLSIVTPDRDGRADEVTLGYATLDEYRHDTIYAGALIGRFANRIAGGQFALDGKVHALGRNEGRNHLHGGARGFHTALWRGEPLQDDASAGVLLRHTSPDGHEGYPGTLAAKVHCTLDDDNALSFAFHATTDAPTPVSLTQHSYFNLAGGSATEVRDHVLTIHAARFLPVGDGLIPVGELCSVAGTAFDFRQPAVIAERLAAGDAQLAVAGCFDHCFVLDKPGVSPAPAARLHHPASGRVLDIATTLPALQFFSDGRLPPERLRRGVALEAQRFPDAPNQAAFPPAILRPGEVFQQKIVYRFSVAG